MRKIETKEVIERRKTRTKILVGGLMIFLLVISTAGYAFFNNPSVERESIKYNDIRFERADNGLWVWEFEGQSFYNYYNPEEINSFELSFDFYPTLNDFYDKPLYYTSGNEEAISILLYDLGRYSSRSQEVCLEGREANCSEDLIVKDCSNSILVFVESEQPKAYKTNNCVFIEGSYDYQLKVSDKIVYQTLGVI